MAGEQLSSQDDEMRYNRERLTQALSGSPILLRNILDELPEDDISLSKGELAARFDGQELMQRAVVEDLHEYEAGNLPNTQNP